MFVPQIQSIADSTLQVVGAKAMVFKLEGKENDIYPEQICSTCKSQSSFQEKDITPKDRKTKPKQQNRTRNGKAVKDKAKAKPKIVDNSNIETIENKERKTTKKAKVKEHRRKSSLTPIRAQTATVSQAHTLIFDMGIWVETGMVIALDFIKVMVNGNGPRTKSCYCRFTGELTKSRDSLIND
ncbi:hypothetical protein Tco_0369311 [Tanacetum coccineum]